MSAGGRVNCLPANPITVSPVMVPCMVPKRTIFFTEELLGNESNIATNSCSVCIFRGAKGYPGDDRMSVVDHGMARSGRLVMVKYVIICLRPRTCEFSGT